MSQALKCDRCKILFEKGTVITQEGEVYESQDKPFSYFRINWALQIAVYPEAVDEGEEPDLCDSCRTDIVNAIKAKVK